jgi:hypothetical protein
MKIAKLMLHLQDEGVKTIFVKYSGGGDSGQIDSITFSKTTEEDNADIVNLNLPDELSNTLYSRAYKLLDPIEDWYNNDGGYGEIQIKVPTGEYTIVNNIYYNQVDTYEHEGNLKD